MDMLEIKSEDLFDYVGEPMGLTKFISDVNQGQVWSFKTKEILCQIEY